jgi:hypothetical protein
MVSSLPEVCIQWRGEQQRKLRGAAKVLSDDGQKQRPKLVVVKKPYNYLIITYIVRLKTE